MMMMRGGTTVATVALFLLMKAPHQELMAPYYCQTTQLLLMMKAPSVELKAPFYCQTPSCCF